MTPHRAHTFVFNGHDDSLEPRWQKADDRVMGGESIARFHLQKFDDAWCACLSGRVSLANRGGFIQMKWSLAAATMDVSIFSGLYIEAQGNAEPYNVHLRTQQLWLPWQSYRQTFMAPKMWQTIYLPFCAFEPYKTNAPLDLQHLSKIGIVAIGRAFDADVCIRQLGFYKDDVQ